MIGACRKGLQSHEIIFGLLGFPRKWSAMQATVLVGHTLACRQLIMRVTMDLRHLRLGL